MKWLTLAYWRRGPLVHDYQDLDRHVGMVNLPEGEYPVVLTLQSRTLRHRRGTRVLERCLVIDIDAPRGIPTHVDSSSGWKGDRSYAWKTPFENARTDYWYLDALNFVAGSVHMTRGRTGFRKVQDNDEW